MGKRADKRRDNRGHHIPTPNQGLPENQVAPEKVVISSTLFYFIISVVVSLLLALVQWSGVVTLPVFASFPLYVLLNAIVVWSFWKWEIAQQWTTRKRRTGAVLIGLPFLAVAGLAVSAQYQREHSNEKPHNQASINKLTNPEPRAPQALALVLEWEPIEMLPIRVKFDSNSHLLEVKSHGYATSSVFLGDFKWPAPRIMKSARYGGYAGRLDITNPYPFPLWSVVVVFDLKLRTVTVSGIPDGRRTESISHNLKITWIGAKSTANVFLVNESRMLVDYRIPTKATALLQPEGDLKDVDFKRVRVFEYNDEPSSVLQPSELHW